ncbi:retrovirus-related pol polyprotein from transposon TNT 1-94 [Tanacetum coccineum]
MMRHLDATKKFVMYPRFLQIFLKNQLKDVPVPMDHFPVPTLTKKVLTFMIKKGKNFSGKVTPLFDSMLVQPTEDEGEASERPSNSLPIPYPTHSHEDQPEQQPDPIPDPSPRPSPSTFIPDSNPESSGANHGGQSSSDNSLSGNEGGLTLQSVYDLYLSLCTQVIVTHKLQKSKDFVKAHNKHLKKKAGHKGVYSKTGEEKQSNLSKVAPISIKQTDYMETEDAQDEGRISSMVLEEKENADKEVSTEAPVSTVKPNEGTDKKNEGTDKQDGSTDSTKVSTDRQGEGTADQNEGKSATQTAPTTTSTPTPTMFGDDETIAQVLITMSQNKQKEKEKGVEIRNVEDTERPRPTSTRSILTLRPLPKINPKDKGKNRIKEEDESDTESEGITEAEKKFKQLANDEEMARKVQEEWEAEEEKKRLAEEEATKVALTNEYDFIQARINADKILAEELQKEEREKFTIEQRAKFLHDTIAAQRKFLAQQRSEAIRNKPPTRNQLRNQMMTYLKHVGGKKHSELKTKTFEEIQVLYERLKRQDQNFVAIGSAEDERQIKEMNEESKDPEKKRLKKRVVNEEDTAKVPAKQEATEQGTKKRKSGHVKMIARKRPRPQPDDDSDDEHRKCLRIITFESTIDSEIMETKSFIARLHKVSSPDGNYLVIYRVNGHFRAFNYLMEVLHIFDRQDLFHLYDLVMKQYSEITPEGIELILWGDLKIMMESSTEENDQEVHFLRKLLQMLDFGLEVEEESTAALHLISDGGFVALEEVLKRLNYRKKVFFLATKDETPEILKNFITGIENQSDHKVKTNRSDNRTEFKNRIMNEFYEMKGIRREFSVARTPQQNGRKHALSFIRPFGCLVTILNTLDHLVQRTQKMRLLMMLERRMELRIQQKKNDIIWFRGGIRLNSTNRLNTVSSPVNVVSSSFTTVDPERARDQRNKFESVFGQDKDANSTYRMLTPDTADLQDTGIFDNTYDDDEDVGAEADLNNLETTMNVEAMQKELLQFRFQKVWRLVDLPKGKHAIGTKWVYRNKKDERGIVVRNKARLVAQDPQFPNNVYMVDKALYGLHQDPRAWYETLSTYLLENGFRRRIIDKTLFIKKENSDNPGIRNLTSEAFSDSDYVELALTKRIHKNNKELLISWQEVDFMAMCYGSKIKCLTMDLIHEHQDLH